MALIPCCARSIWLLPPSGEPPSWRLVMHYILVSLNPRLCERESDQKAYAAHGIQMSLFYCFLMFVWWKCWVFVKVGVGGVWQCCLLGLWVVILNNNYSLFAVVGISPTIYLPLKH